MIFLKDRRKAKTNKHSGTILLIGKLRVLLWKLTAEEFKIPVCIAVKYSLKYSGIHTHIEAY
jgi:hypothetical protein